MKAAEQIWAIAMMALRPTIRNPLLTILVSTLPASIVVMFHLIGGSELGRHALFGTLVVFATNVCVVSMPQVIVSYQARRLQDMFVASPVTPVMYATGLGLSRLLWVAPGLVVVMAVLLWTGGLLVRQLPQAVMVILVTWFVGALIGFMAATVFSSPYKITTAANLLGMLMSVVPPVYYPLALVPPAWRWLPMLLPTTNAAELLRIAGGLSTATLATTAVHWLLLLGSGALCLAVALKKTSWTDR